MPSTVDIESWERKAAFEFFKDYADPYFNIAANLDVTQLYNFCKRNELAFSLAALYYSITTANEIREFRLRLSGEAVTEYESVEATLTILNSDNTFSFCYFPNQASVVDYVAVGKTQRTKYLALKTFDVEAHRQDLIYYSVIPWVSFTSFKHAHPGGGGRSVPRMVFGKMFEDGGKRKMPFSVEVHHALMDGYHVGRYFELFQDKIASL